MDHKVDRAIVRAFFHISFLVDGHEIPLHQSLGHSLHLHILSHSFHSKVTPSSPENFHSSIGVSSIPGALSLGSALSAVCTSSGVISGSLSCAWDHVH